MTNLRIYRPERKKLRSGSEFARLGQTLYRVHFTCALTWTVLDAGAITLEMTR